jgi:hypothetical protein
LKELENGKKKLLITGMILIIFRTVQYMLMRLQPFPRNNIKCSFSSYQMPLNIHREW